MLDEDLYDALDDLHHDLGKHIYLPLALLPDGAPPEALREAARRALLETRRGGGTSTSALELWDGFLEECPQARSLEGFGPLEAAVEAALAWQERLDALDEVTLRRDLAAVRPAIAALLSALEDA